MERLFSVFFSGTIEAEVGKYSFFSCNILYLMVFSSSLSIKRTRVLPMINYRQGADVLGPCNRRELASVLI